MKQLIPSIRKLHWQLSLSYILVIVVTIPALLVVGLAMIVFTPSPTALSLSENLVQLLKDNTLVEQASQSLQRNAHAQETFGSGQLSLEQLKSLNVDETLGFVIINSNGDLVAIYGDDTKSLKGLLGLQASQIIIREALSNDQRLADLVYTFGNGQTIAAVPLLSKQDSPIGVFFVVVKGIRRSNSQSSNVILDFLSRIIGTNQQNGSLIEKVLLPFTLLIIIISVISMGFGLVTARHITQRLQQITKAAHSWSKGQFQVIIDDHSSDELGLLAQDLNWMALQVQNLFTTQQQLTLMEERQRITRDLHDSVKQQTFAVTLLPDLADAVRKAARGMSVNHPHVAARMIQIQEEKNTQSSNISRYAFLSDREREVLQLIAEGCSNREIATRLVISEKTAKSHVRNILSKLYLEDRTQVAIFAWREGLI